MVVKKKAHLFNNESGEVTIDIDNYNACQEIVILVTSGSVSVSGKIVDDQESNIPLNLISCNDGSMLTQSGTGLYIVFGGEALSSVTFSASEPTEATAKFIY